MVADPRPLLDELDVRWQLVCPPSSGYDGSYEPAGLMLHWTGGKGNAASNVVATHDYHCCVGRDAVAYIGGWDRKAAHGGNGRSMPQQQARDGQMTLDSILAWQCDTAGDDTSSGANRYFAAVAIDNDGIGEPVSAEQWYAWTATAAVFLRCVGVGIGSLLDHSSSTARKIDIATSPALPPVRWWADIDAQLRTLDGGQRPGGGTRMYRLVREQGSGHLWLSDKLTIRWLETQFDVDDAVAQLERYGYPTDWFDASREAIRDLREHGVITGPEPPW